MYNHNSIQYITQGAQQSPDRKPTTHVQRHSCSMPNISSNHAPSRPSRRLREERGHFSLCWAPGHLCQPARRHHVVPRAPLRAHHRHVWHGHRGPPLHHRTRVELSGVVRDRQRGVKAVHDGKGVGLLPGSCAHSGATRGAGYESYGVRAGMDDDRINGARDGNGGECEGVEAVARAVG